MLKIQNLKKHFSGVKAVNNCSFEIKPQAITALIGLNGAGKSTVFNLVSGILKADAGKIIFNNKNITNSSIEKISNSGVSRLFQQSRLFNNLTVQDNFLLALNNEDTKFWSSFISLRETSADKKNKAAKILKLITMENFADTLARDLSYGQKRLVELGRAILNPHKFLMLDEPVAGVTPKLREKIAEILLMLKNRKETILLIEHDMNFTFKIADDIIVLERGKVIAKGKPSEIKDNPKVLEAYLGE